MSLLDITQQIPTCGSDDSAWIAFHKSAKKRYGKSDANILWRKVWQKRADETGAFTSDRANTEKLREYMAGQGVTIEGSVVDNVTEGVGDVFGFFSGFGKTLGIVTLVVLAVLLIAVFIVIFKSIKDPSYAGKVGGAVASTHPCSSCSRSDGP